MAITVAQRSITVVAVAQWLITAVTSINQQKPINNSKAGNSLSKSHYITALTLLFDSMLSSFHHLFSPKQQLHSYLQHVLIFIFFHLVFFLNLLPSQLLFVYLSSLRVLSSLEREQFTLYIINLSSIYFFSHFSPIGSNFVFFFFLFLLMCQHVTMPTCLFVLISYQKELVYRTIGCMSSYYSMCFV